MRCGWCIVILALMGGLAGAWTRADDLPTDATVLVTDVDGKETKVTGVKFTTGTHRLAWLADPKGITEDARKGPLAIEVREEHSTTFTKGVVTLVPVASLESAKYDYDKKIVSLAFKGLAEPLNGTLQYKGLNVLGFGGLSEGNAATFTGGVMGKTVGKTVVKAVAFSGAQPLPPKPKTEGLIWSVQIIQPLAQNPTLKVRNLKVLYQFTGGSEQLVESIPVRKGPPIPFNETLQRVELLATDTNTNLAAAEVEVGAGPERVIAIPLTLEQDKKTGTLVGFLGEVDAGWKLFPLHTVKVIKRFQKKVE